MFQTGCCLLLEKLAAPTFQAISNKSRLLLIAKWPDSRLFRLAIALWVRYDSRLVYWESSW